MVLAGFEQHRLASEDIWVIPNFAQDVLKIDPDAFLREPGHYPSLGKGKQIEEGRAQWVTSDNEALLYRGHELKQEDVAAEGKPPRDRLLTLFVHRPAMRNPPGHLRNGNLRRSRAGGCALRCLGWAARRARGEPLHRHCILPVPQNVAQHRVALR